MADIYLHINAADVTRDAGTSDIYRLKEGLASDQPKPLWDSANWSCCYVDVIGNSRERSDLLT